MIKQYIPYYQLVIELLVVDVKIKSRCKTPRLPLETSKGFLFLLPLFLNQMLQSRVGGDTL
jgi:hypothetical protein